MKYWNKVREDRVFKIKDLDCVFMVETITRKYMLEYIDDYIENLENGYIDEDTCFNILYKDGTVDRIDYEYDGHKIRKINIMSITSDNSCTTMVYGNFEMNEYGVVTPSEKEIIDNTNIVEITK